MINTKEYSEAIVEVLDVLQHLDEDTISRIPLDFIKKLKEQKSQTYKSNIDFTKDLSENNLKHQTKVILALIYRDYICETDEEREEFDEMHKAPIGDVSDPFKTRVEEVDNQYSLVPQEENKSFFKKIVDKLMGRK